MLRRIAAVNDRSSLPCVSFADPKPIFDVLFPQFCGAFLPLLFGEASPHLPH
jgi:hypothetical protein